MNRFRKRVVVGCVMLGLGVVPQLASAEADSDTGSGSLSAAAHLNLRVVIPGFLLFKVGSAGTTVDRINFDMTSCVTGGTCTVGDSIAITGTGGDAAGGSGASVALFSNAGAITITESNDTGGNGLVDGGNSISLDEITASSDNNSLLTPTLSDSGGNTSSPALTGGSNVTVQNAVWTYSYDNTTVPDPGTYDVEITYTAASL
ncbi:MAG: hypothetical protein WCH04_04295 [Gammaproteobacteria bacterium]